MPIIFLARLVGASGYKGQEGGEGEGEGGWGVVAWGVVLDGGVIGCMN